MNNHEFEEVFGLPYPHFYKRKMICKNCKLFYWIHTRSREILIPNLYERAMSQDCRLVMIQSIIEK